MNNPCHDGHKILSLFINAGYPTIESTVPSIAALANAGADAIEHGILFSASFASPLRSRSVVKLFLPQGHKEDAKNAKKEI